MSVEPAPLIVKLPFHVVLLPIWIAPESLSVEPLAKVLPLPLSVSVVPLSACSTPVAAFAVVVLSCSVPLIARMTLLFVTVDPLPRKVVPVPADLRIVPLFVIVPTTPLPSHPNVPSIVRSTSAPDSIVIVVPLRVPSPVPAVHVAKSSTDALSNKCVPPADIVNDDETGIVSEPVIVAFFHSSAPLNVAALKEIVPLSRRNCVAQLIVPVNCELFAMRASPVPVPGVANDVPLANVLPEPVNSIVAPSSISRMPLAEFASAEEIVSVPVCTRIKFVFDIEAPAPMFELPVPLVFVMEPLFVIVPTPPLPSQPKNKSPAMSLVPPV